ncbi:ATP-binding protein [Elusimicrobiota bacterium]
MIISIASGKGGTGKTTVAVSFALSLSNVQILDCDVEEPNVHIFLKPDIRKKEKVYIPVPEVDLAKCNFCGKCQEVCEYNAIVTLKDKLLIFPELCHGCGACAYLCPEKALKEVNREIGVLEIGDAQGLDFVHGILNIGEAMSPPLIKAVKEKINPKKTVIIDAPPGTSCPVIAAIKNTDFCILVTEPTPFGLHDLKLSVKVLKEVKIPFGIVINRSDLGDKKTEQFCQDENIPILMKIPFKKEIAMAYSKGVPIVDILPVYKEKFILMFQSIKTKSQQ